MNRPNPYAEYDKIVYGDRFVGRQDTIRLIQQRIINADDPGNLSIVGVPMIGKSSLAYHTLIYPQPDLIQKKLLTLWISLPSITDGREQLFRELVAKSIEVLFDQSLERLSNDEKRLAEDAEIVRESDYWIELQENVCNFFKKMKRLGWRIVAILDDFDSAKTVFKGDEATFQALRELVANPTSGLCFVTTSKRTLSEISRQSNADVSIFPGSIFREVYLRHFDSIELEELLQRTQNAFSIENQTDLDFFSHQTGGHPYLASTLAFELFEQWLQINTPDMAAALEHSEPEFFKYYDYLIKILREDNSLKALLQFLSRSRSNSTSEINRLSRYGLLQKSDGSNRIFSEHFQQYLAEPGNIPDDVIVADSSPPPPDRTQIFVSYSRQDMKWLETFMKHMNPILRNNQNIHLWTDNTIKVGEKWKEEIDNALEAAKIAILLVTPDFLNSSFILNKELPFLLNKARTQGLKVFWIPVKASSVEQTEINDYQAAYDPKKPIAKIAAPHRDDAWVEICRKLKEALA